MLTIVSLSLSVIALLLVVYAISTRKDQHKANQLLNKKIQKLRTELVNYMASFNGIGQRIIEVENRLDYTEGKIERFEEHEEEREVSYKQVNKMVELGGSAEDLVESCGLTKAEAHLIKILKSQQDVTEDEEMPEQQDITINRRRVGRK